MDLNKLRRLETEPTHQLILTILQDGPRRPSAVQAILSDGASAFIQKLPEKYREDAIRTVKKLRPWNLQNVNRYLERLSEYHHVTKITHEDREHEHLKKLRFEMEERSSVYFATPRSHELLVFSVLLFENTMPLLNKTDQAHYKGQCIHAASVLARAEAISQICQESNTGLNIPKRDKKYRKRIKSIDQDRSPDKKIEGRGTYTDCLLWLQQKCSTNLKGETETKDEQLEFHKFLPKMLEELYLPTDKHWDILHIVVVNVVYLLLAFPSDNADPKRMVDLLYRKTYKKSQI